MNSDNSFFQCPNTANTIRNAGSAVAKDIENLSKQMEKMEREMKTGFQFAEAQLMTVWKEVSSLSHTVEKVSEQVHNNALAILDQREELMIKDQLNQVQFYLLQLDG